MFRLWNVSILVFILSFAHIAQSLEIDLSRRRQNVQKKELQKGEQKNADFGFLDDFFMSSHSEREMVILNTKDGFVPRQVQLVKGMKYKMVVVNVNESQKNVSFILDGFSQYHGTYFGKVIHFDLTPKKEGIFPYQCPETSMEGKMVVIDPSPSSRGLASEKE